jgi:hypothetical protein
MRLLGGLLTGALVVVLAVPTHAAPPAKTAKKGAHVHGVVMAVKKDADKDAGTVTIKVHVKKKGQPAGAQESVEKTFTITDATKFQTVRGKKGDQEVKPATFAGLHKGEHVLIVTK